MSRGGAMVWLAELGLLAVLLGVIQHYRTAATEERLRRLNGEATADSTHHFLRGQLQVATRLVLQQALARHATATVTIRVPGATVVRVDTIRLTDTLHAQLDTNGVHVGAVVALVPPPTWSWSLRQDPLTYRATLTCEGHAARLTVEGPPWQELQLTDLAQAPWICNPAPRWSPLSLRPPSALWVGAVALGTYLLVR